MPTISDGTTAALTKVILVFPIPGARRVPPWETGRLIDASGAEWSFDVEYEDMHTRRHTHTYTDKGFKVLLTNYIQ